MAVRSRRLVSLLVDDEIDALYDLPAGDFIAARDALVKRLRAEKRRDEANEVKGLRRPSVAAWTVNQLARRHPEVLDEVIEAGTQLASAQRRALSGIKDAGLQSAAARRRTAIEQAWQQAEEVLESEGAGAAAQRQAVVATLEAASVDSEAAAAVQQGRLTKELAPPSDFGAVSGFALVPAAEDTADADDADADSGDDSAADAELAEEERRRAAVEAAALARGRAERAQEQAGDARQAAVRAAAEAQRLREQADKAEQRAAAAERKAEDAAAKAADLEGTATTAAEEAERLAAEAENL